ncbi:glycoside hydrolase [Luteipulveratus mongoliensis]|uniref:Glycoside hydrolase n=1 Tax=Luteipulveratus mongoliensis TaxID=571913 RepID=A0A0K1JPF0_9MICO|nr:glycoside hydrolase [Luteipulveratus mongoliensis]
MGGQAAADGATTLPNLTAATQVDAHTVTFTAGAAKLRITAITGKTLHVEMAPDGTFTNPDDAPSDPSKPSATMLQKPATPSGALKLKDEGSAYRLSTPDASLTITKADPKLTLTRADGTVLFREASPLTWSDQGTTQTLAGKPGEQFYGAGEQNGSYTLTGKKVNVANSFNWNEGGYNNSQPYYVSTAGYGVFRHTFAPGAYTFGSATDSAAPVTTTENEQRYDAYYFVGDLKSVIGQYTDLVGKPFMPPIYGLELGDSDCYLHNANRGERHTLDSLKVAQGYVDNGMPNGWMLVNDGYGCGYEKLPETGAGLQKTNMQMGLWTESDLTKQEDEVKAGVRVRKLDVAWVGPGYRFSLDGCETAYSGIEKYSDARGFVYQPNSWAGAQRCSVLWSGDQSGSWDYIRWQIPTYASSTMSGIAYNTGDVDGIFGGSPKTYARDLQWKSMLPTTMTMDGWAPSDKQPYRYGDDINAINKKYLLLKERLLPYSYSYSAQAHQNGVGQVRPLYLQYPNDPAAQTNSAKYEFMSGDDFLVAPVYSDTSVRNGIYLPKGTWVDYWSGKTYTGPTTINGYNAPLDKLPMFVRGGAVVPMWSEGTTSWKTRDKGRLSVDVFPQGTSSFDLYEDDGVTRKHAAGQSSTQKLSVRAPQAGVGTVQVTVGAIKGTYDGQAASRGYDLTVHSPKKPAVVKVGAQDLKQVADAAALAKAPSGWYYDAAKGIAHVKTTAVARSSSATVSLVGASAVVGSHDDSAAAVSIKTPAMSAPGSTATVPVTVRNDATVPLNDMTVKVASDTDGITASPATITIPGGLQPGASKTVNTKVSVSDTAKPGSATLTATFAYSARSRSYSSSFSGETVVPYATLAKAYDNVGVTDAKTYAQGDLDGGKDSLYGEGLAAAGIKPGATVTSNGLSYTWPGSAYGTADNAKAATQTIAVKGRGKALGLLGTATAGGGAGGQVTVTYSDGTTSTGTTGFPNWLQNTTNTYNATTVTSVKGRYTPTGYGNGEYDYRVYSNTVALDPAKDVVAVTLPGNASLHVFALSVGTPAG